jgi:hypothetical protein
MAGFRRAFSGPEAWSRLVTTGSPAGPRVVAKVLDIERVAHVASSAPDEL